MIMINKHDGMTLIELLIVVAIIGVLVGLGYPSYTKYVVRAKRAEAISNMMELSQWMERYYTETGGYTNDYTNLPYSNSPKDGGSIDYQIRFLPLPDAANNGSTTFKLRATPQGGQASNDTDCGALSINHAGVKCIKADASCSDGNAAAQAAVAACF